MPKIQYDINSGMTEVFGPTPAYTLSELPDTESPSFDLPPIGRELKAWARVEFLAGRYKTASGFVNYDGLTLPESTWVGLSLTKNIIETPVVGRRGTLKELINEGDWKINIRGMLTDGCFEQRGEMNDRKYPHAEIRKLQNLVAANTTLAVLGDLFSTLGIQNIVIKSFNLPPLENFPFMQPFELEAVSDEPLELFLAQNRIL
jgi:hypothetical protein